MTDLLEEINNNTRSAMQLFPSRRAFLMGVVGTGIALGSSARHAFADAPKRGGDLRVAMLGGGPTDTLDPHMIVSSADNARANALFEALMQTDQNAQTINCLAEEFTPNTDATRWTIRLRKGVRFHDGKPLTSKDVQFSLLRITDAKSPKVGATQLRIIDFPSLRLVDDLTLEIHLKTPCSIFADFLSDPLSAIVPEGFDPQKPIGTGPFKYRSFTAGQESVFDRHDDYWQEGLPYLNSLTIIDSFGSDTAAFNALQGGQIDVLADAPLPLVSQLTQDGSIKALISEPGIWTPFTMRVDQPPFNDVRVRQAFRLIVDREQMVKIAFNGYAVPGNDVFGFWDPAYDQSLKRSQDIDKAKSLLREAGQENLTVELVTSDIAPGAVQSAQVFARQAQKAGVTINVRQVTPDIFFGDQYLSWTFAQDFWYANTYLSQISSSYLADSPFNETHWKDEKETSLYQQALQTVDAKKRDEIIRQMQKIDFEEGGYIIATHNKSIDLMAQNVEGFKPGRNGRALGGFGFHGAWMS